LWSESRGLIRNKTYREELPAVLICPAVSNSKIVVWLSGTGKSALYASDGSLAPEVKALVNAGTTVLGVDLLHQGEFLRDGKPLARTPLAPPRPRWPEPREAAAYTFGYNDSVFVQRVHDILTTVATCATRDRTSELTLSVSMAPVR
jgi:hypothetical protein